MVTTPARGAESHSRQILHKNMPPGMYPCMFVQNSAPPRSQTQVGKSTKVCVLGMDPRLGEKSEGQQAPLEERVHVVHACSHEFHANPEHTEAGTVSCAGLCAPGAHTL